MLKGLACGGTPALAMNGHMLKLASGGCLNLNELPPQEGVTLEMLQACRDRIFLLESQAAAAGPVTTRPSDSRIMELAERLKVPELGDRQPLPLDLIFKRVQQHFHDEVCELQSKSRTMCSTTPSNKKARVATAVTGNSGNFTSSTQNEC